MSQEAKSFQNLVCKLFVSQKLRKEHDLEGNEKAQQEIVAIILFQHHFLKNSGTKSH